MSTTRPWPMKYQQFLAPLCAAQSPFALASAAARQGCGTRQAMVALHTPVIADPDQPADC